MENYEKQHFDQNEKSSHSNYMAYWKNKNILRRKYDKMGKKWTLFLNSIYSKKMVETGSDSDTAEDISPSISKLEKIT